MAWPDRVRMRNTAASPVAGARAYPDAPRCRASEAAVWPGIVPPPAQLESRVT
jgi:hypothetical protein